MVRLPILFIHLKTKTMKTKILIILSLGFFAFILSSWTMLNQAPKKTIIYEEDYNVSIPFDEMIFNTCSFEYVHFTGNIHTSGKYIMYDDYTGIDQWHFNYQGVSGIGMLTGDTYHYVGASNGRSTLIAGQEYTFIQHEKIIHQGGDNFTLKIIAHKTVNTNGDVTSNFEHLSLGCN